MGSHKQYLYKGISFHYLLDNKSSGEQSLYTRELKQDCRAQLRTFCVQQISSILWLNQKQMLGISYPCLPGLVKYLVCLVYQHYRRPQNPHWLWHQRILPINSKLQNQLCIIVLDPKLGLQKQNTVLGHWTARSDSTKNSTRMRCNPGHPSSLSSCLTFLGRWVLAQRRAYIPTYAHHAFVLHQSKDNGHFQVQSEQEYLLSCILLIS